MSTKQSVIWAVSLTVIAAAISLILSFALPSQVPTHFDASGHANGFGPKAGVLAAIPGVMLVFAFAAYAVPSTWPDTFEDSHEGTWLAVGIIAAEVVLLGVHLYVLHLVKGGL